ncbi:helix-turn-helix domain-containing protein [Flavobacterium sp. NST-5]|uniref:Helix-turn-helix domain-containing protein n=1 Tax=Flavobacterium ichthyis TaxID=2698827 RepID=A0ABW9Z871_9FLAO|nr:helix-turn-helix domain-containing protein [Flavobacterium ichthyis]NBL65076.1 helix-turn-helix domain-containing protein [Flavobacterium ichthyis]
MKSFSKKQISNKLDEILNKIESIEERIQNQKSTTIAEEPINVLEVSKLVNLSVSTIYSKVSRNEIPVNKVGKKLYFFRSELEQWIRSGRIKTTLEIRREIEIQFKSKR